MTSKSQIKDELEEFVKLGDVRLILSEYIPCDRNSLESINQKLMAKKSMQGKFVTMLMDSWPERAIFQSEKKCSAVRIIEYKPSEYIQCEATMQDPEDTIVQDEMIGMRLSHEGNMIYGCRITHITGKEIGKDPTASLDLISRVIPDIMYDSSLLIDTLLTHHQRSILDCVFKGTANNRYKFVGLIASSISPAFDEVSLYLDGEDYQNELEQVLDDIRSVQEVSTDRTLIMIGEGGILLVSPDWRKYESLVIYYCLLRSAELFVDALFNRISLLNDELNEARNLIERSTEGDYSVITKAQNLLTEATANYTILNSTGGYLDRGFGLINEQWSKSKDSIDSDLLSLVAIDDGFMALLNRIRDIDLVLNSIRSEVEGLQTLLSTQIEQQMRRLYSALRDNTRSTSEVIKASERTGDVLDVIQLVLSGTIAFDIIMAFTGEYTTPLAQLSLEYPLLFFLCAIILWVVIVIGLKKAMDFLGRRIEKEHMIRQSLNIRCDPAKIEGYLADKVVVSVDEEVQDKREVVRTHYLFDASEIEKATVTLTYDRKNGVLQDLVIECKGTNVMEIKRKVLRELEECFGASIPL